MTDPTRPSEMACSSGEPLRLDRDEAIGYALLETDHLPGFARRGPAFAARLAEAGWEIRRSSPWRRLVRRLRGRA